MNWLKNIFKESNQKPTALRSINLCQSYPDTLSIAIIRPIISDVKENKINRIYPPDLRPKPAAFRTPKGVFKYTNALDLSLASVLCVNETGKIIQVQMRDIYLALLVQQISKGLNLSIENFFEETLKGEVGIIAGAERVDPPILMYLTAQEAIEAMSTYPRSALSNPAIIADIDSSLYSVLGESNPLQTSTGEYHVSYWTTTHDTAITLNLTSLEITARNCLNNNPPITDIGEDLETHFLKPLLQQVRTRLNYLRAEKKS